MTRTLLTAAAALALAACSDVTSSPIEPGSPSFYSGQRWDLFYGETPTHVLDASPGWEVATRFYTTVPGCVMQIHFYRAPGETGTNYASLWEDDGTLIYSAPIAYSGSGWATLFLESRVGPGGGDNRQCIQPWTYYRVSVNTNTRQGKTFGYFDYGAVSSGPVVADYSFYGPVGQMPNTGSGSAYFVGLTFEES